MEINVEELWLSMVTFNQCCICRTRDELRNALFYRHYPFCEVAVLSNAEEAHCYAQQRYHANFFANPYLYGYPTMPLPNTANNTDYNIRGADFSEINLAANVRQNQAEEDNLPTVLDSLPNISLRYSKPVSQANVNDGLFWAIDAMNGFAVASNVDALIYFLLDARLIYSHAVPYGDEYSAAINSRSAYLNRFACRYGFGEPVGELPYSLIRCGEIFTDTRYEEREHRRTNNQIRNNLMLRGLL